MVLLWVAMLVVVLGVPDAKGQIAPAANLIPAVSSYTLNVTVGLRSPDCFSRWAYELFPTQVHVVDAVFTSICKRENIYRTPSYKSVGVT